MQSPKKELPKFDRSEHSEVEVDHRIEPCNGKKSQQVEESSPTSLNKTDGGLDRRRLTLDRSIRWQWSPHIMEVLRAIRLSQVRWRARAATQFTYRTIWVWSALDNNLYDGDHVHNDLDNRADDDGDSHLSITRRKTSQKKPHHARA